MKKANLEQRAITLLNEESNEPLKWFYCSFADDLLIGFLGSVIVEARGIAGALVTIHGLGISPGGQMLAIEMPSEILPPEYYRNRLLSKAEIIELWPDSKSLKECQLED